MESKPIPSSSPMASLTKDGETSATTSSDMEPVLKDDNFFDFHGDADDIWGPNFTKSLRKTR